MGQASLLVAGFCLLALAACFRHSYASNGEAELVSNWADDIGKELWDLASEVARREDLLTRYRKRNIHVDIKNGNDIVKSISQNVGRMLRRKMDAVRCLQKKVEEIANDWKGSSSDFTYYSAKYSNASVENEFKEVTFMSENMQDHNETYRHMYLEPDTHFNNIPVNTSYSSVHIPTNVYNRLKRISDTIHWSEALDKVFKHNYKADPALMWQYFCATNGMLRQFPAMRWPYGKKKDGSVLTDIYDCRIRTWFIEATTCSKDVVILVDSSGSMYGMSNTIAKATVSTILSTLSNNDFVAVFSFSDTTKQLISCFQDQLVQVTPENVKKFNDEMTKVKSEGVANVTEAFMSAFTLLENYRNESRCGCQQPCNQIIMLITDSIASNITEVFREYNWFDNGTIPVRVFTYLIGNEVTNVREIQWMACLNRGYYSHIHTQAEVQEQVLKYVPVVARPLVLNGTHPIVWTHAYIDISRGEDTQPLTKDPELFDEDGIDITEEEDKILWENNRVDKSKEEIVWRDRLLTSVSMPVYDYKANLRSATTAGQLLGVVGTDVLLKDIRKLTLPYKLGVNGYAFIVSNNGYVVLHPALKPEYKGQLKLNFDSIDLTEVEILDDGSEPRQPGEEILEIRNALVNHDCGNKTDVKVKLHYDDYRRVNLESRDYYYDALPFTPFGIAVVLPKYARNYIKVGKEIEKDRNLDISELFLGENWGIHPEWVYCRYHYLEGHEFDTPEDEMRHFLKIIGDFSKSEDERLPHQYKHSTYKHPKECSVRSDSQTDNYMNDPIDCGDDGDDNQKDNAYFNKHRNDHYCNKELMELLVLDAVVTNQTFSGEFSQVSETIKNYNVFLRFVSTQSGLTRWQRVEGIDFDGIEEKIKEFSARKRALDEPWYKGAILQHDVDNQSVSVTVPPIQQPESGHDAVVTISLGVFPLESGLEAPAGVVGFQLPMQSLHEQFKRILTENRPVAGLNCSSPVVDCYLVDQNGYIIISDANHNDTGKFFGTLDQTAPIMRQLVDQGLFHAVDIYDYLAVCTYTEIQSAADVLKTPFVYAWNLMVWLFARIIFFSSQLYDLPGLFAQADYEYVEEEPDFSEPPKKRLKLFTKPCDMKMTLYISNKTHFDQVYSNLNGTDDCALPFYARRVRYTNLLLIIVKTDRSSCYDKLDVIPYEIFPYTINDNITEPPCHRLLLNDLPRRRLEQCFTVHENESMIEACGGSSALKLSVVLLLIATLKDIARLL